MICDSFVMPSSSASSLRMASAYVLLSGGCYLVGLLVAEIRRRR
ncbi:hypothetical protein [Clavibacter michiganensis]